MKSLLKKLKLHYSIFCGKISSRFRRYLLGKNVSGLLISSKNGLLAVDPEDNSVGHELANLGVFAESTLDELLQLVGPNSHVMVAGAHVGALAIPISKQVARVVAFEANPNTFRLLEINKKLNKANNLELHQLALGSTAGTLSFLLNKVNSGGSKRKPKTASRLYYSDNPEEITVPMVSADAMLPDARFDLIIMDIEGSETDALKGMPQILSRTKHLFIEYLPHHLDLVAGVSDEEFVDLLTPHFTHAKHHQSPNEAKAPHLLELFKTVRNLGGGDVLLSA